VADVDNKELVIDAPALFLFRTKRVVKIVSFVSKLPVIPCTI